MKSEEGFGNKKMKMMRMRGFMCQSTGAMDLMVCRSSSAVIVPRKKILSNNGVCGQFSDSVSSTCSTAKYMRLVESPSFNISEANPKTCSSEQPRSMASILPSSELVKDDVFQIVVMKVSIHCQGCAGKVKKHLSKMKGVTSFSIDVEAKRVIVIGHVSPAWVIESLSKVKKAELWTL